MPAFGHIVEPAGIEVLRCIPKSEDGVEVVWQELGEAGATRAGDEKDAVIIIHAIGDVCFVVLQQGHHREEAGPLVGIRDGLECFEAVAVQRSSIP